MDDYDICPHCGKENHFTIDENHITLTGMCRNCGEIMMLCDLCRTLYPDEDCSICFDDKIILLGD